MFVKINNREKNPVYLEWVIKRTRNDGKITPEFAMEILSMTNHSSNIKTLVRAIKENCKTKHQLKPYREFILSCVNKREVSSEVFDCLCEMADLCGCREEFDRANNKPKFYEKFDCEGAIIQSREEFENLKNKKLRIYFDTNEIDLSKCVFSEVKGVMFKDDAIVNLSCAKELSKDLDVSMCYKVRLDDCDLSHVKELKFREGSLISLSDAKNLPKDLDVSMCGVIFFEGCDLKDTKELKFREGARVYFIRARNLPENLDISMSCIAGFDLCDLSGVNEIKFKDRTQEDRSGLSKAKNYMGKKIYASDETDPYMVRLRQLENFRRWNGET